METTFAEILEMRHQLDAALAKKTGQELMVGFYVDVCPVRDGMIAFKGAIRKEIGAMYCVSGAYCKTPQEAFDSAMNTIDALKS